MSRDEIYTRLTAVFRDVFDDESICVDEHTSAEDIDDWDSLAQITLIAAVEHEFGVRFDMKTALKLKNAGAMADQIMNLVN